MLSSIRPHGTLIWDATSYLPYAPGQQMLLPAALQEWLPEGHLAYFISDTIDSLELSAFHARYAQGGARNQPYHPAMMVKVLVYGYATGVFSSRKLARKLHEDVAFRVLAAGNYPAHRTICDFRALHLEELSGLFVQVVKLARECGLVKLGTIAVDGTKIKANASRHKAMSYERMQKAERSSRRRSTLCWHVRVWWMKPKRTNRSWMSSHRRARTARGDPSPKNVWSSVAARPMRRGGERTMMSVGVAGLMARSRRGRATNASSAPLSPTRRRVSPIATAG